MQWAIAPTMGRNLTRSQVGAGGQMGRNGGVPKMLIRTPSIVSGTCIEAATVQESLWNLILLRSPCQLRCHTWLLAAAAAVESSKIVQLEASTICPCILLLTRRVCILEVM